MEADVTFSQPKRDGPVPSSGRSVASGAADQPSPKWRRVLSLLIALHLLAVVAEPLRFFTRSSRGTSPVTEVPRRWLGPYIDLAYLSHGYFFFAPEPGPSHLIDFHLVAPDGKQMVVRYPDRHAQWPRLLYHRHFMLAENLNQLWVPPWEPADPGADPSMLAAWKRDRARFEAVRDSMARHVAQRFGAQVVGVDRIEHILPSDIQVFDQHMRLNDPRLYVALPDALPAEQEAASWQGGSPLVQPGALPWRPGPIGEEVPATGPVGPAAESTGQGVGGNEAAETRGGHRADGTEGQEENDG